jgi:hypothetical protein
MLKFLIPIYKRIGYISFIIGFNTSFQNHAKYKASGSKNETPVLFHLYEVKQNSDVTIIMAVVMVLMIADNSDDNYNDNE